VWTTTPTCSTASSFFGRSYVAESDVLVKELAGDEAIKVADTLLLTIPNQKYVAPNSAGADGERS
jgi:hypothetical protein